MVRILSIFQCFLTETGNWQSQAKRPLSMRSRQTKRFERYTANVKTVQYVRDSFNAHRYRMKLYHSQFYVLSAYTQEREQCFQI